MTHDQTKFGSESRNRTVNRFWSVGIGAKRTISWVFFFWRGASLVNSDSSKGSVVVFLERDSSHKHATDFPWHGKRIYRVLYRLNGRETHLKRRSEPFNMCRRRLSWYFVSRSIMQPDRTSDAPPVTWSRRFPPNKVRMFHRNSNTKSRRRWKKGQRNVTKRKEQHTQKREW